MRYYKDNSGNLIATKGVLDLPEITKEEYNVLLKEATKPRSQEEIEAEYWANVDYNEAVESEIAKRYTIGQELAIQRQKDEKPEEYAGYYDYCEQCKAYVKEKKGI